MKQELIKFVKFNLIGIINTLIDMGAFWLLTFCGIGVGASHVASYMLGLVNSFVCNSRWTFKQKKITPRQTILFVAVNLVALLVSLFIIEICANKFMLNSMVAKVISLPFSLGVNYIGNAKLVFPKEHK